MSSKRNELEWAWNHPPLWVSQKRPPLLSFLHETKLDSAWLARAESACHRRLGEAKTRRLGERFEAHFFSLLETHPEVSEIRTNIPIGTHGKVNGKTAGEVDCIVRLNSRPKDLLHLEIAVKFYLCVKPGGSENTMNFMGPALKDSLYRKIHRLETHQLSVLKGTEFEHARSEAWMTGILFYPVTPNREIDENAKTPKSLNPNHSRGVWVHEGDLDHFFSAVGAKRGSVLETKSDWIRSRNPKELLQVSDLSLRIHAYFKNTSTPIQCEILTPRGELVRVFVVANPWPSPTA